MPYPPDNRPPNRGPQKQRKFTRVPQPSTITYLLLLGLIVGGIPLLGLVRGVDDLAGRRAERLRRSPGGRHCEEINLSSWEEKKKKRRVRLGEERSKFPVAGRGWGSFGWLVCGRAPGGISFALAKEEFFLVEVKDRVRFVRSPCSENPLVLNPIGEWWGPLLRAYWGVV